MEIETIWLLKQWVFPALGSSDMCRLAAASPILSSATRKDRVRMLGMQLVAVPKTKSRRRVDDLMYVAARMCGRYGVTTDRALSYAQFALSRGIYI